MSIATTLAKRSNKNLSINTGLIEAIKNKRYLQENTVKKHNQVEFLIDCSGSMSGVKISQAKSGIISFFEKLVEAEYVNELISFADSAELTCPKEMQLQIKERLDLIKANGFTNMSDALLLAESRLQEVNGHKVIVVATDGCPNSVSRTLEIAGRLKRYGVIIITIGTDDANESFLEKLASSKDMGEKVKRDDFQLAIEKSAKKILALNM